MVRVEMTNLSARVNLTITTVKNQMPTEEAVQSNKFKVQEPKPFCGIPDAMPLENFIFNHEK